MLLKSLQLSLIRETKSKDNNLYKFFYLDKTNMSFTNRFKKKKYPQSPPIVPVIHRKSKSSFQGFKGLASSEPRKNQGIIDYKNIILLRKFITAEGKILPRRISRLTAKQQRYMAKAIKNARMTGFLPFLNKINKSQTQRT